MAMLISKFHRLIQSRLLWLGFLVVVVFSFVIWGTQMPTAEDRMQNDAGILNGEGIPFDQYQQARFNTYLAIVLMTGRAVNITPELEDEIHSMAWQRLASLREAEALGITSSNDEVINSIRNFDFLKTNGRYNPQAYDQFAQQFLAPMRATKRDFEEHVRQEIVLQKLRILIDRMMLVSPREIERTYETLADTFQLEYVRLTPDLVAADVAVSDEDVEAYFAKDPEQFRLPEMVKVKAAVFPVADFASNAEISDEEIQEYYDFNIDQFAVEEEASDSVTNAFSTSLITYRPLDEVRDEIVDRLAGMQAAILAENKANEFVQMLSDRREAGRAAFDQAASEFGVEMIMTAPFTAREIPAELEAGADVTRAAFNLTDDDDYYYSDPVVGSNNVYVLALVEKQPERIPEFGEVREEVEAMAAQMALMNKLTEQGQKILEEARAAASEGTSFDDVLSGYGLSSQKPAAFSLSSSEIEDDFPQEIIRHVLVCNEGEFTDLVPAEDGSILLARVTARTPSVSTSIDSMRPQIITTLRRQSSQVAFRDYQNYLLERGGFVDNLRRSRSDDDGAGEDDAEAEPEV